MVKALTCSYCGAPSSGAKTCEDCSRIIAGRILCPCLYCGQDDALGVHCERCGQAACENCLVTDLEHWLCPDCTALLGAADQTPETPPQSDTLHHRQEKEIHATPSDRRSSS